MKTTNLFYAGLITIASCVNNEEDTVVNKNDTDPLVEEVKVVKDTGVYINDTYTPTKDTKDNNVKDTVVSDSSDVCTNCVEVEEVSCSNDKCIKNPFVDSIAGINLGNTFENTKDIASWNSKTCDATTGVCSVESDDSGGVVTKAQIDYIASKGFNYLRIPVTVKDYVGPEDTNTINPLLLDRVGTVIEWALSNNMYVSFTLMHENFWLCDAKTKKDQSVKFSNIWRQIATRYKDFDYRVIFEAMNEPRYQGCCNEWNGGEKDGHAYIAKLNKVFLETVRSTGGNNSDRWVLLTPYAANANVGAGALYKNMLNTFDKPGGVYIFENVKPINVGVSVHFYSPWNFVECTNTNWTNAKTQIENEIGNVNKWFVSNGFPAIITEFGVSWCNIPSHDTNIASFITEYVGYGKSKGLKAVWWDNNKCGAGGDNLCLINRTNLSIPTGRQELIDAFMAAK